MAASDWWTGGGRSPGPFSVPATMLQVTKAHHRRP